MNNHQLLTRKAVILPETAVVISQALVGAECIIRMHHFDVLWSFCQYLYPLQQK